MSEIKPSLNFNHVTNEKREYKTCDHCRLEISYQEGFTSKSGKSYHTKCMDFIRINEKLIKMKLGNELLFDKKYSCCQCHQEDCKCRITKGQDIKFFCPNCQRDEAVEIRIGYQYCKECDIGFIVLNIYEVEK